MTETMPDKIKNNFIYARVWRDVRVKDRGAVFLVCGDIGSGKSSGAIKMAYDLDPDFGVERICFSVSEMLRVVEEGDFKGALKAGSAVILDEAAGSEDGADSRNALTKTNKILSYFSTISRVKRLVIFYIAPFLSQMDKRVRLLGLTGLFIFREVDFNRKLSKCSFYWCLASPLADKVITPRARLIDKATGEITIIQEIRIPLPPKELVDVYKEKKNVFVAAKIKSWREELLKISENRAAVKVSIKGIVAALKKNPDLVKDQDGKISLALIRERYDLTESNARATKRALEVFYSQKNRLL